MNPKCQTCGANIFFAPHHQSGKMMVFDAEPDLNGAWLIEGGRMRYTSDRSLDQRRFMPHHATCPSWKKKKK